MNDTVRDAIAEAMSTLVRVVDAPTGDLGFGSDLSCATDLTSDMAEVDQDSPLGVAQAAVRRITTARGTLLDGWDEANNVAVPADYGIDVIAMLNAPITATRLEEIPGQVRSELKKDDRIDELVVSLAPTPTGNAFELDIKGSTATGPFSLTFGVTDGDAALKEINGNPVA